MFFKKKESQEQRDLFIAYKQAFGGDPGKMVLYDLMNRFHILNSHKGSEFGEGQRSAVLHILGQCKMNIKEFDKLLSEQIGDSEQYE